jgi:hypothetical protein
MTLWKGDTMKTNGKRTRIVVGKRYPDYDKQDMAILASARRWLNANGMKEHSAFPPEEADRRVAFYAAQVAAEGRITRWLAPAPPKPRTRYRTRFAYGDALGHFGQVSAS